MPIWLRRYTFNEIKEYYDTQNKKTDQLEVPSKTPKVHKPDISPSYTSKVSKK